MDLLHAPIQYYDWGDPAFIAQLQRRPPSGRPEAELWMGAHPGSPSRLAGDDRRLDEVIAADPMATLGAAVAERFGALPFLAKVLAAARPLSIQTHPSLDQARSGFAREEADGVPRDAPTRTYRDAHHKPELICALTRFEAKCGFRHLESTREFVSALCRRGSVTGSIRGAGEGSSRAAGPLIELADRLGDHGVERDILAATLEWLMRLDPDTATRLIGELAAAAAAIVDGPFARDAAWVAPLAEQYPHDPGVAVALLLNHVELEPGEAVFLAAGNLHAYLRGAGVELMANSDNVVRGGLTSKHVDVDELLDIVDSRSIDVPIQVAVGNAHRFDSPVPEFSLERRAIDATVAVDVDGPEVLLVTDGAARLTRRGDPAGDEVVEVPTGTPVWLPAQGGPVQIDGTCTFFRCRVGNLELD